jgi:hypothetical protein
MSGFCPLHFSLFFKKSFTLDLQYRHGIKNQNNTNYSVTRSVADYRRVAVLRLAHSAANRDAQTNNHHWGAYFE